MAFGKVYCFGPTFRAEKSKTRRHLTEFWMVEPEMAFADLEDVKRVAEEMVVLRRAARARESQAQNLQVLERDTSKLETVKAPFPRMSYDEAVKKLQAKGSEIQWGGDFGNTDETLLTEDLDRPVMVDRYPGRDQGILFRRRIRSARGRAGRRRASRRKVTARSSAAGSASTICDLLLKRIEEHKLPREAFEWYLDLRKFGAVPHAGFGMGVERLVAWICGLEHVRETIPYPRMLYRTRPDPMRQCCIAIIGAPMDLGAGRRGVDMGPSALRLAGLDGRVRALGYEVQDLGNVAVDQPEAAPVRTGARTVSAADCANLHPPRRDGVPSGEGTASCLWCWEVTTRSRSGTVAGLSRAYPREGRKDRLIWIDAHADMNTPDTSPSGNVHGMPLACCIGQGPPELTRHLRIRSESAIRIMSRSLAEGRRSDERSRTFASAGVAAFTMREIDERGLRSVMDEAIERASEGTAGFHVSFDMDCGRSGRGSGVGTPVRGGLTYREAHLAMEILCDCGTLSGMEVVEVNPVLDVANQTADSELNWCCRRWERGFFETQNCRICTAAAAASMRCPCARRNRSSNALDPERYKWSDTSSPRTGSWNPRPIAPEPGGNPGIDVVFPVLHGTFGEDGTMQGLLEMADLPYVGPGVLASSAAMDKEVTKRLCVRPDCRVVDYAVVRRGAIRCGWPREAVRLSRCSSSPRIWDRLSGYPRRRTGGTEAAVTDARRYDNKVIVERAIVGKEVECAVLGNDQPQASTPCEILPFKEFYDYEDKYLLDKTEFDCLGPVIEDRTTNFAGTRPRLPGARL